MDNKLKRLYVNPQGHIIASNTLSGVVENVLWGDAPRSAKTQSEAIQLVYVRANWNYNYDSSGKKRFAVKPTTAYSKELVERVIKAYTEYAYSFPAMAMDNWSKAGSTREVATQYVAAKTKTSNTVTQIILNELYATYADGTTNLDVVAPRAISEPTAEQKRALAIDKQRQELDAQKAKTELEETNKGLFYRFTNSIMNTWEVGLTTARAVVFVVVVAVVVAVLFALYGIYRFYMKRNVNTSTSFGYKGLGVTKTQKIQG